MANYGVEQEREKNATKAEMGEKKYAAHQAKWAKKVADRKRELSNKIK